MNLTYKAFESLNKLDKINLLEVEGKRLHDFKNDYQSTQFFKLFDFFVAVSYNKDTGKLANIEAMEMIEKYAGFSR